MTDIALDPRPAYSAATAWVQSLLEGLTADQLGRPTPSGELDVRALAGHLTAHCLQVIALAESSTVAGLPNLVPEHDAATYADARARGLAAWAGAPLDGVVTAPWGEASGSEALATYVNEALVHGWDIAVATGQPAEIPDGAVAVAALEVARVAIPAELRAMPEFPFGPVVEPREGTGPTERLANWNGRSAIGWGA
ncbi:TIGR03086 family protein [Tsukamurella sp. M9C]|uniref:TIGR03086 family metal-binding protein n=1 Tax=unclassified Tsukamurella TaxID=2633480 RepID=UPI001CC9210D|nr:TIGR03086 family metal-binding protein [Tsukamurella sp. M9C]MCA0156519.1 TIGR03086 family protein [Tsukamurella sp. M9C]